MTLWILSVRVRVSPSQCVPSLTRRKEFLQKAPFENESNGNYNFLEMIELEIMYSETMQHDHGLTECTHTKFKLMLSLMSPAAPADRSNAGPGVWTLARPAPHPGADPLKTSSACQKKVQALSSF